MHIFRVMLVACCSIVITFNVTVAEQLNVVETDNVITINRGDSSIVTYNKVSPAAPDGIDSIYARSGCLHPVFSPNGLMVTQMFPVDHPHQHGIFSAWVKTTYDEQAVDFWNLAGRTGRVLHERVASTFKNDDAVGFEVDLLHRVETNPPVDVLRERWKISAYTTDDAYHCFDLESTQTAITNKPLTIEEYHYGGMVLRGPTHWLTDRDSYVRKQPEFSREPSSFLNDLGSDRVQGNHEHAKWVASSGTFDGQPVSITVLSHPANFRAPQAARLHPSKPYFCFAPCVDGKFVIDRDHPLKARYRYLVTDAEPDAKWLDEQWNAWASE